MDIKKKKLKNKRFHEIIKNLISKINDIDFDGKQKIFKIIPIDIISESYLGQKSIWFRRERAEG